MAQKIITQRVDLRLQDGGDMLLWPNVLAVKGDSLAHLWRVEIYENGVPADLTGQTAQCYVVNGENSALLTAMIAGNVASVSFPQVCYANAGAMKCLMSVMAQGQRPTVAMMQLRVLDGITDVLIDPDDVIPSVTELQEIAVVLSGAAAAESGRVTAEQGRTTAESGRSAAETARASAEQLRATAEALRITAETARANAEGVRATAETARANAEGARATAETARTNAEGARATAETARANAEAQRQTNSATALTACDMATSGANMAAGAANTAAGAANAGASAANTAAGAANAAATKVDGLTVAETVVPYGTTPQATVSEVDGHLHIALETQQGPQGTAYTIKGVAYATVAALQAAVPSPTIGDQYNVGSAAPYHVYRWTGATWEDQGELQGPSGYSPTATVTKSGTTATINITDQVGTTTAEIEDGATGDSGATFTPSVNAAGMLSWSNDKALANPTPVNLLTALQSLIYAVNIAVSSNDATTIKAAIDACLKAANVYNALDKSVAGFALDARQGKSLQDALLLKLQTTLLWTNASPSSTFAAQTIGGSWSAYTAFIVEYNVYIAQVGHRHVAMIAKSTEMSPNHYLGAFAAHYWRYVVINDGGAYFYDGYYRADGGAATADNTKMIPCKIWGIKEMTL